MNGCLPLLHHSAGETVAWSDGAAVTREAFLGQVAALAAELPEGREVVNLCEDRYRFLLLFCAALLRGQTNLLAPNGSRGSITRLLAAEGSYCATDTVRDDLPAAFIVTVPENAPGTEAVPAIPADQVVATPYTSGSTGSPRPHPKRWGEMVGGAGRILERLTPAPRSRVVATVPAQHMFGLETSILLPLVGGLGSVGERPFFPADVHAALAGRPEPALLITTPFHLRALVAEGGRWPRIQFILSATAPMPDRLAAEAERLFEAPVLEIFGSTETGAVATRRTVEGGVWRTLGGVRLREETDGIMVHASHLTGPVHLGDQLLLHSPHTFTFRGRHHDMLKIAGKRASLAELNQKLLGIPGLVDGAFIELGEASGRETRLAAVVVAPEAPDDFILKSLAEELDPVFLPRRICRVGRLPRDANGKLPRETLLELLNRT